MLFRTSQEPRRPKHEPTNGSALSGPVRDASTSLISRGPRVCSPAASIRTPPRTCVSGTFCFCAFVALSSASPTVTMLGTRNEEAWVIPYFTDDGHNLFGDRDVDGYLLSLRAGGDRDPRGDRLDREVEDEDRAQTEEEIGEEEAAPYLLCQGPLFRCDHEGDPCGGEGDDVGGDYHRRGAGKAEEEEERDPYDDQAEGDEIDFDGAA